jgi:hypothetical protein
MDTYTESLLQGAAPDLVAAVTYAADSAAARGAYFFTDSELLTAIAFESGPARTHLIPAGITPGRAFEQYERLYQPRRHEPRDRPAQPNGDVADWLQDARVIADRMGATQMDGRHVLIAMLELGQDGERKWGSPLVNMLGPKRAAFEARLRADLGATERALG